MGAEVRVAFHIGGRVPLAIESGPYAGVTCEVDSINSAPVQYGVLVKAAAIGTGDSATANVAALRELYDAFASIGRPVWNVVDPRGPVPATTAGMLAVPAALVLALVNLWTETYQEPEPDPVDDLQADIARRAEAEAALLDEEP